MCAQKGLVLLDFKFPNLQYATKTLVIFIRIELLLSSLLNNVEYKNIYWLEAIDTVTRETFIEVNSVSKNLNK